MEQRGLRLVQQETEVVTHAQDWVLVEDGYAFVLGGVCAANFGSAVSGSVFRNKYLEIWVVLG